MSEQILKALMQLFAIIAHPENSAVNRRNVVLEYLNSHLDKESSYEYLELYDKHYAAVFHRTTKKSNKIRKYTSASSVKVLKICTKINEELTIRQKIVVLIQLLEFLKTEASLSEQENDFIQTVSDTFNFQTEDFETLKNFILSPHTLVEESDQLLTISSVKTKPEKGYHLYSDHIGGEVKILRLAQVGMYVMRFNKVASLYMNGQVLSSHKVHILTPGSSLRAMKADPIYYSDIVGVYNRENNQNRIVFEASNIEYRFNEKQIGIHSMSFKEESGKMVGIVGASGAGKTTLLNVLNGSSKPYMGNVYINGNDVFSNPEKIDGVIGYVSQDDLLIESLTVFENLYYNAKLCFSQYSRFRLIRITLRLLKDLGLFEARNLKVGSPLDKKISGGQRKRLNIALELIREPAVLFVDEPTSGLSSRDSVKIMDLLKNLSLKGKLIFVVIHQPSSEIFKMFDRLLILDTGGFMIFNGNPLDSITYFKSQTNRVNHTESECPACGSVDADQIFDIIESEVIDEYGMSTQIRKVSPKQWYQRFKEHISIGRKIEDTVDLPPISFSIPKPIKQFGVFIKRDIKSKLANRQYLFINLLETPILAFLLSYIIKFYTIDAANDVGYTFSDNGNLPVYLFMSVIVALFVGLTVSAEEIIKDRMILKREKFLNLSKSSYLMSKVVILFSISAFQSLVFVFIGNGIMEVKSMFFYYWLALFSTWCFANLMGLILSDSFKTVITIYILIPFILIPQIILSGVIVKFDKLNPAISSPDGIPLYGEVIVARWAYEALAVKQFKDNEFNKQFYVYDKLMSKSTYKKNYWIRGLKNKMNFCKRNLKDTSKRAEIISNLSLIKRELDIKELNNVMMSFPSIHKLHIDSINKEVLTDLKQYLTNLYNYYASLYNRANLKKDELLMEMESKYEKRKDFIAFKKAYCNDRLKEFVLNQNDVEKIVEYDGKFFQKVDPIYKDPTSSFIKAHFYAPRKNFLGRYFDTYWVNIFVIWTACVILYLLLYYSALQNLLNIMEKKWKFKLIKE
ncbi:MAG: ATP-binding cassette domain-containing protein [Marinifilaceae bacterium]|jgi:ABC-type multidrug transport system ATPase subunit|nr:ATP-binding cassette domain-containing protein [Marinifilaceae bacterium]